MPNCFQLRNVATGEIPSLQDIDRDLCEYLGKPVSDTKYYEHWVDIIGLNLAFGKTWGDVELLYGDDEYLMPIIEYLSNLYQPVAWAER